MRLRSKAFENSSVCRGEALVTEGAPSDMAIVHITGRYPAEGEWAINHHCHEVVTVVNGAGRVAIHGAWHEIKTGEGIHIPPDTAFAWDGTMTLAMSCTPPFDPEQYEIIKMKKEEQS